MATEFGPVDSMDVYARVSHRVESLTAFVNRYRLSPRQSALWAALIECLLKPGPAVVCDPDPPMPSSLTHKNKPVRFSTQSLPPVIKSGPAASRFSLGRAQPAPLISAGRVKLRPKSVEKVLWKYSAWSKPPNPGH